MPLVIKASRVDTQTHTLKLMYKPKQFQKPGAKANAPGLNMIKHIRTYVA